jgi:hypothetical protein
LGAWGGFAKAAEKAGVKKNSVNPEKLNTMIAQYVQKIKSDSNLFAKLNNYNELAAYLAKDNQSLNKEIQKYATNEDATAIKAVENSDKYIRYQLKALLARNLYDANAYYQVIKDIDDAYLKAVEIIKNDKMFDKLKGK